MQDIDFDELDRAVNSALQPSAPKPTVPEPVAPESAAETPVVAPRPATPTPAPAARRNAGRFMDMVHASSDMRPAAPERSPLARPIEEPAPATVGAPAVEAHSWPDPIDFASGRTEPAPAPMATEPQDTEEPAPQDSPFLTGAKVEKRPLGGDASSLGAAPLVFEEPEELLLEAPEEIERIGAVSADTEVSEELPVPSIEEVAQFEAVAESEPAQSAAHEEFTGPVSIQQQYTDKPSSADEPGAIYDTESYHQPLTHPVKKKSGLWIILWIFLLVIFGAGAGAAVYFFVLPML